MKTKIIKFYIAALVLTGFLSVGFACQAQEEVVSNEKIIKLTNQERQKAGLPELTTSDVLNQAAMLKAEDMVKNNYFAHTSPQGVEPWHWFDESQYQYKYAGENLAMDFTSAESVDRAWMKSPSHRENILSDKFHEIGVAVVSGIINDSETQIAVQLFGTQLGKEQQTLLSKLKENTTPSISIGESSVYPWKGKKEDEMLIYAKVSGQTEKVEAQIGDKTYDLQPHRDNTYMNLLMAEDIAAIENNVVIKAYAKDHTVATKEISKSEIASLLNKDKGDKKTIIVASSSSNNDILKIFVKQNVILSVGLIVLFVILANIWVLEKEEEKILANYQAT